MPAIAKSKKKKRFPKRELNTWLRKNSSWNHLDWEQLLSELENQGFEEWTTDQDGRDQIGLYLESNRK